MGTSKSYGGMKGKPNWAPLSSSVTRACEIGKIPNSALNNIASNFVKLIGGSNSGGRGHSTVGGRAGIKTAQKLGGFLSSVQSNGFRSALSGTGFDFTDKNANDAINYLLEHCAGAVSSIDEVAAKAAEKALLEEIGSDAKTIEELEKNFDEKVKEYGVEELLVRFYADYLYEHLSIDFDEKLIKEKGKQATDNFYTQLKDFLFEKVKNVSKHRDISKVNFADKAGNDLVKNIFEDTLKAFEGYES
jgi:8-oxo-dGTP pyrophosphatase MutT (NUDIX family)